MGIIYLRLKGGIGNQLFMYFAALSLSVRCKKLLVVDKRSGFKKDVYRRLPKISFIVNDVYLYYNYFYSFLFKVSKIVPMRIFNLFGVYVIREFDSRSFVTVDLFSLRNHRIILVEGYFQSYHYFDTIRDKVVNSVFRDFQISYFYQSYFESILDCNSVALHVRRVQYDDLLDLSYYLEACNILKSKLINPIFFIFSDDINWCKECLNFHNAIIIEADESDEVQELFLMSRCRSHIVANSSFSWWGAYLASNNDQLVIAPRSVQIGVKENFWPDHWILI